MYDYIRTQHYCTILRPRKTHWDIFLYVYVLVEFRMPRGDYLHNAILTLCVMNTFEVFHVQFYVRLYVFMKRIIFTVVNLHVI